MQNEKLDHARKALQRKVQRLKKKKNSDSKPSFGDQKVETFTPRSKTDHEMLMTGTSPRKHKDIRKKLLFLNVLETEIKQKNIQMKFTGLNIAKKYKQIKAFGKVLGKDRRTLTRKHQTKEMKAIKVKVQEFLQREDNAVTMPGKKDTVCKEKLQKKILTDYLHNLHAKFTLENPGLKISR